MELLSLITNIATLMTAIVGLSAAVIALVKTNQNIQAVHVSVNSELAEFKRLIASSSRAEGVIEGKAIAETDNAGADG